MRGFSACAPHLLVAVACALAGCVGPGDAGSFGFPSVGLLRRGHALPRSGEGFVLARPSDPTRYGNATLTAALARTLQSVQRRFPGTPPMRVGDLAYPGGGKHPRHGSHRSGRDVDVIFHAVDAAGVPVPGSGFLAFDRFGVALAPSSQGAPAGLARPLRFDVARNWHFVRTLIADEQSLVQWIFCSRGIKALLLEYAARYEPDAAVVMRATTVLHQPSNGRPHADHFHIRVLCTDEERQSGCEEQGPVWPWLRERVDKSVAVPLEALDDRALLRLVLEDLPTLAQALAGPA